MQRNVIPEKFTLELNCSALIVEKGWDTESPEFEDVCYRQIDSGGVFANLGNSVEAFHHHQHSYHSFPIRSALSH
jgi:hypothetical protein